MRLGVLVSGRGSNLEAVLAAIGDGRMRDVEPVIVVSNRAGARALDVAARHAVPSLILRRSAFAGDAAARDAAIGRALTAAGAELALLAGYDQVLTDAFFSAFAGRTINVHPSLLPAHGGPGMLGSMVHASVLAAGERTSGATIHEVTRELDAGPILARAEVPVELGDDVDRLAARVLEAEHRLCVATLRDLALRGEAGMRSATMGAARPAR